MVEPFDDNHGEGWLNLGLCFMVEPFDTNCENRDIWPCF